MKSDFQEPTLAIAKMKILSKKELNFGGKRSSFTENDDLLEKKIKLDSQPSQEVLPDEIWLKIMSFLKTKDLFKNFAQACKSFHRLSLDSSALKYLKLKDIKNDSQYEEIKKLLARSHFLRTLSFESSTNIYWSKLMSNYLNCSKINSLKIVSWMQDKQPRFKHSHCRMLKRFAKDLQHLELKGIHLDTQNVMDIAQIKTLKTLKISWTNSHLFTPENILEFAKNCYQLESIQFFNLRNWMMNVDGNSDNAMKFKTAFNTFFEERKETLKSLSLANFTSSSSYHLMDNLNLCQNLEEFCAKDSDLTDVDLASLVKIPNLKNLFFDNISTKPNEMTTFFLGLNTSSMKYLTLHNCNGVNEAMFSELSMLKFPLLERIHLKLRNWDSNDQSIDMEQKLEEFIENCPNLKSIQLYGKQFGNLSKEFLTNLCQNREIYVNFGTDLDFETQLSMEDHLRKEDFRVWRKYQSLKNEFLKWCQDHDWWYDNEYHRPMA